VRAPLSSALFISRFLEKPRAPWAQTGVHPPAGPGPTVRISRTRCPLDAEPQETRSAKAGLADEIEGWGTRVSFHAERPFFLFFLLSPSNGMRKNPPGNKPEVPNTRRRLWPTENVSLLLSPPFSFPFLCSDPSEAVRGGARTRVQPGNTLSTGSLRIFARRLVGIRCATAATAAELPPLLAPPMGPPALIPLQWSGGPLPATVATTSALGPAILGARIEVAFPRRYPV